LEHEAHSGSKKRSVTRINDQGFSRNESQDKKDMYLIRLEAELKVAYGKPIVKTIPSPSEVETQLAQYFKATMETVERTSEVTRRIHENVDFFCAESRSLL